MNVIGVIGKEYDRNGRLYYTGNYKDKKFHGEGKMFTDDGGYYQGHFNKGMKNGLFELHTERGIIRTAVFMNDYEHGECIEYFGNGKIKSITHYHLGKKNGKCIEFAGDGKIIAQYENVNDERVN